MLWNLFTVLAIASVSVAFTTINPIAISGKHFVDSVTNERFYLRGIDYQPGGSAAYDRLSDPLSNVDKCARDVYLLQQLGVNTVRVYTVNPHLNHDACMTMLAAAGIYSVLDVNSPLVSESINRYEPWTTYTPAYLRHVFEVVDQFSRYNNTLGFFIGNEIVNDERSASVSPPFIRSVARDVKDYMHYNCPRSVPVGYSAADDLRYRTQLPHYLTCGDPETALDFYGVNSYQWCGQQTLETSGYDVLIKDHQTLNFPVFFSEFGCNHIQPRVFQEVEAIFSPAMTPTFEGGLVYEFSQESNDYGLVVIDSDGDAYLKGEFYTLEMQYEKAKELIEGSAANANASAPQHNQTLDTFAESNGHEKRDTVHRCLSTYSNSRGAHGVIPDSFGTDMIRNGVRITRGRYDPKISKDMPESPYSIYDVDGQKLQNCKIRVVKYFDASTTCNQKLYTGNSMAENVSDKKKGKNFSSKVVSRLSWGAAASLLFLLI